MNDPRPAFLFHVRDFWTSEAVELMSFEEVGLYLFLLSRQWETGSIPADANALRTLCRGRATSIDTALAKVLQCFENVGSGRLQNARLEFERARIDERSDKAKASANARWRAWKADRDANAMRTHSGRNAKAMHLKGREGKGIEEKTSPVSPSGKGNQQAQPTGRRQRRKPDSGWEPVLARDEYAPLRDDARFGDAWTLWIEHTRTSGSKAREPSSLAAAAILNVALREGAARFADAVQASIAGNWQGIHYPHTNGAAARPQTANKTDRALDAMFQQARDMGINV